MRGPYTRTYFENAVPPSPSGWRKYFMYRQWYRQDLGAQNRVPLSFLYYNSTADGTRLDALSGFASQRMQNLAYTGAEQRVRDALYKKAYDEFVNRAQSTVSLGVDLFTGRQTWDMILVNLNRLRRAASAALHLDPHRLARELRVPRGRVTKLASKHASTSASLWLEYSFGWVPLLSDITDGLEVLSSPIKDQILLVRRSARHTTVEVYWNDPYHTFKSYAGTNWRFSSLVAGKIRVDNPNLALAQRLGLINPAEVIWEIVPWSFVVDWFIPVGDFISSWSQLAGVSIVDGFTTTFSQFDGYQGFYDSSGGSWQVPTKGVRCVRALGVAKPRLNFAPRKAPSITRCANALSLLVQQLTKMR